MFHETTGPANGRISARRPSGNIRIPLSARKAQRADPALCLDTDQVCLTPGRDTPVHGRPERGTTEHDMQVHDTLAHGMQVHGSLRQMKYAVRLF
jgi:hypothetical protein